MAVGQAHAALGCIHVVRAGVDHFNARRTQTVKAVAYAFPTAQSGQIQVGERAGVEALFRLHQRDAHARCVLAQIARGGGTAKSAADDDDVRGCVLRRHHSRRGNARGTGKRLA
ncbi:hypothetical protein SDC9_127623 [bioreactor metagenome]|uniref:Uncharacterized protein n=1 Tax=bioreactor metagenome TaxID=1076179 RepID=A0A645CUL4_9ZZZZ